MKKKENPILCNYSEAEKKLLDKRVHEIKTGKVKPVTQAEFHLILQQKHRK